MLISIVIPCYNSEKTIGTVVEQINHVFMSLEKFSFEIILINDNSKDNTFEEMKKVYKKYSNILCINLSRNFGQQNAIMAGLKYAEGDLIIGMDDDLQTPPSQIPILINKIQEGYDIVYGKYPQKKQTVFRNLGSKFNNFTVRMLIGKPKNLVACSFWIARKYIIKEIIKYENYNAHIQGLFLRTTKNICNVTIEHHERKYGKSNYTIKKLLKLWSGFLNFTLFPLRLVMGIGFITFIIGILSAITIIIRKILYPYTLAGWTSLMVVLLISVGIILLSLGIVGEYVGRILMCINENPQYVIKELLFKSQKDEIGEKK